MSKRKIPKKVKEEIKKYVQILKDDQVKIDKVFLFGSYARGDQNRWSDIDLCIVSPKFKNYWKANSYLWSKRIISDVNYCIEPVGFNNQEFSDKSSMIVSEIKKNGIEIKI